MKSKLICWLLLPFVFSLICISNAKAEDILLSNPVSDGYHITDTNIETEEDNCTITVGSYVLCVAQGTTSLNPGFVVEKGAVFAVFSGTPSEISESIDYDQDGLPDWWEFTYFSSIDPTSYDDSDGDGVVNLTEYNFDTDPSDSNSKPPPGMTYEYDELGRIIYNSQMP